MKTNEYGQVSFETDEILSMLYAGQTIDQYLVSDVGEQSLHQKHAQLFEISPLPTAVTPDKSPMEFHREKSSQWQMPQEYQDIDLETLLSRKCADKGYTDALYMQRIVDEMEQYKIRGMTDTLKFLHYLIQTCTKNNIVTGIGRGSSVSSLVLHLLDVHHIDPVKYNLDYKEFLR